MADNSGKILVIDDIRGASKFFKDILGVSDDSEVVFSYEVDKALLVQGLNLIFVNAHLGQGRRSHFKGIDLVWEKIRFSKDSQIRILPVIIYSPMGEKALQSYSIKNYGIDIFRLPSSGTLCRYFKLQDESNPQGEELLSVIVKELLDTTKITDLSRVVQQETYYSRLHQIFEKFRREFRHTVRRHLALLTNPDSSIRNQAYEDLDSRLEDLGKIVDNDQNDFDLEGIDPFFINACQEMKSAVDQFAPLIRSSPSNIAQNLENIENMRNQIAEAMEKLIDVSQLWFVSRLKQEEEQQEEPCGPEDTLILILEDEEEIAKHYRELLNELLNRKGIPGAKILMLVESQDQDVITFNGLNDAETRIFKSLNDDSILDDAATNNALEYERRRRAFFEKLSDSFLIELNLRKTEQDIALDQYREKLSKFAAQLRDDNLIYFSRFTPELVSDAIGLIESFYNRRYTVDLIMIDIILRGDEESCI